MSCSRPTVVRLARRLAEVGAPLALELAALAPYFRDLDHAAAQLKDEVRCHALAHMRILI